MSTAVLNFEEHRALPKAKPKVVDRRKGYLQSVIARVRNVLLDGTKVYLQGENSDKSYVHRLWGIRLHPTGEYFQVKTTFGWTPVLYSETLVDENGNEFFSSPKFSEMNDSQLDLAIGRFIRDFGVLPTSREIRVAV